MAARIKPVTRVTVRLIQEQIRVFADRCKSSICRYLASIFSNPVSILIVILATIE